MVLDGIHRLGSGECVMLAERVGAVIVEASNPVSLSLRLVQWICHIQEKSQTKNLQLPHIVLLL
jgi:hypothetical protein